MDSTNAESSPKRKATEPSKYVDLIKTCKRCQGTNVTFKFLNNKKEDQPRYQCHDCTLALDKPYLFNPFPIREHNHVSGYAKLPKVETEELKNLHKVCDHCQVENNATFRGYNNGKANQPRYACKACKHLFSPLKNSRASSTASDESSHESQTAGAQYQETGASQQPRNYIDVVPSYGFQIAGARYQETGASQQPSNIDVVPSYGFQTAGVQYQETGASQQPSNIDVVPSYGFQTAGVQYQETGASQQPSNTDVFSYGFQTTGVPYQATGALQQPNNIVWNSYETQTTGVPYQATGALQQPNNTVWNSYETQTTGAPYQETGALQQPNNADWNSYEFQTTGAPYQETRASQQPSNIDVSSYGFQTTQAPYQETGAVQQPSNNIDVSSQEFQTTGAPYQETGALQQPHLYNGLYEPTPILRQPHNSYDPYARSLPSMDVAGSSNQFPADQWQDAETWQWQQRSSLDNTLCDQTPIASQQHGYDYANNQSSDNQYLAGQFWSTNPIHVNNIDSSCHFQGQSNDK